MHHLKRRLIVSEKMPSYGSGNTTTSGALTFVDLDYYLLGVEPQPMKTEAERSDSGND